MVQFSLPTKIGLGTETSINNIECGDSNPQLFFINMRNKVDFLLGVHRGINALKHIIITIQQILGLQIQILCRTQKES